MKKLVILLLGLPALAISALTGPSVGHTQEPSGDDAAWAAAEEAGTAEACQQYLGAFPGGRHAEEAFACLIEGSLDVAPAAGSDDVY